MELRQPTPNCSDFDVVLVESEGPAFRVLLPEHVRGDGLNLDKGCHYHIIPGVWQDTDAGVQGRFDVGGSLAVGVDIASEDKAIFVSLTVTNRQETAIRNVFAEVCASVNRMPDEPNWCNRQFLPGLPLDRFLQGRHWYERLTPQGLSALTPAGWIPMHPHPDDPDADQVPLYSPARSGTTDARACAVPSPDGGLLFFQAWNVGCEYVAPFPGNACMHLSPFLGPVLAPGASLTIHGLIGMHEGDRDSLARRLVARLG